MVRVLVIDDEPDVLLLCRVNLRHAGFEVLEAQDGEHGIADAMAERPDAIVLDLMLPTIDGYDVLRTLREDERTSQTPILVLTAKAQRHDRRRCLEMGADDVMTKPFSPEALGDVAAPPARRVGPRCARGSPCRGVGAARGLGWWRRDSRCRSTTTSCVSSGDQRLVLGTQDLHRGAVRGTPQPCWSAFDFVLRRRRRLRGSRRVVLATLSGVGALVASWPFV